MALRNAQPITFRPQGVTDSLDGTNSFSGSMSALSNLIPADHTPGVFVPRPAAEKAVDLTPIVGPVPDEIILTEGGTGITTEDGFYLVTEGLPFAGVISVFLVLGTRVYGMVASSAYPGYDEPFCYDLDTAAFVTITGVEAGLLPTSPTTAGDWIPPTIVAVTNSTIIITHPGYPGGSGPYFGWIDESAYSSNVMTGNTTVGSPVLQSVYTLQGNSAPILQGVQPGMAISGAGIPAGAYVVSAANGTFSLNTTGNTHSNTTLDTLGSTVGVLPGMTVTGPGIVVGTYVAAVAGPVVTLSQAATATGTGVAINFSGGGTITMSANATATADLVALLVEGGTELAPRYSAGNTNTNPLSEVPRCSYGFSGRAYYGVGPYIVYSDPLNALQVSQASQALAIGDSTHVTALTGVPLTSQLTGGIQQSMTVFKGAGALYQITGDAATNDLRQNVVNGSIGTRAPRTIAATPLGIAFMAPDGLRILTLAGTVSEPIGIGGTGVAVPFLNAVYPSRMCAAYAENVYRITVQNGLVSGQPTLEYWLDMARKLWTGPHTFPSRMIAAYSNGSSFLVAPLSINGSLWMSDVLSDYNATYVENGVRIACSYVTSLLPDNQQSAWNRVVQMSLAMSILSDDSAQVTANDETGVLLGNYSFSGFSSASTVWGGSTWGGGVWGGPPSPLREYAMRFEAPLFFRQASITVTFSATRGQSIGNIYAKVQPIALNVPPVF